VPSLDAADPRFVHYHEGLNTGQRGPAQDGGSKRPLYRSGHCELAQNDLSTQRICVTSCPYRSIRALESLRREWGVQYSVLLDDDTEVDLLPQDDGCKLYYGRSNDQEHVVDLGAASTTKAPAHCRR
jgi:hypothetical protein